MYISEIRTKAPADERMPLERKFYDTLEKLKIPYYFIPPRKPQAVANNSSAIITTISLTITYTSNVVELPTIKLTIASITF